MLQFSSLAYVIVSGLLLIVITGLLLWLRARVSHLGLVLSQAQLELEGANNRLIQNKSQTALLSRSDPVTGLLVRHVIVERFQLALAIAQRQKSIFGVILIRIVDFDSLTQQQHDIGVRLLAAIGARLLLCTREIDTIGRVRDHEFALLLPLLQRAEDLELVVQKVRATLDAPFILPGIVQEFCPKIYFGSALYPQNGVNWSTVLKSADDNLQLNQMASR